MSYVHGNSTFTVIDMSYAAVAVFQQNDKQWYCETPNQSKAGVHNLRVLRTIREEWSQLFVNSLHAPSVYSSPYQICGLASWP